MITTSKGFFNEVLLLWLKLKGRLISVVVFVSALLLFIAIYFSKEIMVVFNYMNETLLQAIAETYYLVRRHHFEDLVALFSEKSN